MTKLTNNIKTLPTLGRLNELFRYCPETGYLFWKFRTDAPKQWNTRHAGKQAGSRSRKGYWHIYLNYRLYSAHRVIWKMVHGSDPSDQIDHIDGDRVNNKACNLRTVSGSDNHRNQKRNRNNASGVTGVSWAKDRGKWRSYIMVDRKIVVLGHFTEKQTAIATRKQAERDYGYHPNHGRSPNPPPQ